MIGNIACLVSFTPDLGARTEYSIKIEFYFGNFRDLGGSQNLSKLGNLVWFISAFALSRSVLAQGVGNHKNHPLVLLKME